MINDECEKIQNIFLKSLSIEFDPFTAGEIHN